MTLKILLPFETFAVETGVLRIVAETHEGSVGFLPHRLDCVATLTPGILIYETDSGEAVVALDEGILVKTGSSVIVSVRRAIAGSDLNKLRDSVEREFIAVDEREQSMRSAMERLEIGFLRRFAAFQHER